MNFFLSDTERKKLIDNHVCSSITQYRGTQRIKVLKLVEDYVIAGIPCKAEYPIFFDYNQYFEPARFILLAADIDLAAIGVDTFFPFAKGTPLTFGEKGKIAAGILSRDFNYNGVLFKAKTKVTFQTWNSRSVFWSGIIKNNEIIDGYHCLRNTEVTFENGELQTFYPALNGYKDYNGDEKQINEKCVLFPT